MLTAGQQALNREQAILLLTELSEVQERLDRLRADLRALDEDDSGS